MAWRDLTTLYRGQPWFGPSKYLKLTNQGLNAPGTSLGLTKNELSKLAGQYWTKNPNVASSYAGSTGKIRSMNVPSSYLDKFSKFEKSVVNLPSGKFAHAGAGGGSYLVPKSTLKNIPSSIDYWKTLKNILPKNPIKNLVEDIRFAYPSWMGEGYTVGDKMRHFGKDLSKVGLGYLKDYGARTLTTLGSLPVQAGILALTPTPANADDEDMTAEDFRRLAMKEVAGVRFHSKRRNIPGTPLVRTGDGSVEKTITRNFVPSGDGGGWSSSGADLSPGGGYGQSPTGSDIAGTPFSRGGILGAF